MGAVKTKEPQRIRSMEDKGRQFSFVTGKHLVDKSIPFEVEKHLKHVERSKTGFICKICRKHFQLTTSDEISVNNLIVHCNGKYHKQKVLAAAYQNSKTPAANREKRELLYLEEDYTLAIDSHSDQLENLIAENELHITCGVDSWSCLLCKIKIPYSCQKDYVNCLAFHLNSKVHKTKVEAVIQLPSQSRNFPNKTTQCEVNLPSLIFQSMLSKLCNNSFATKVNEKHFIVERNRIFCIVCKETVYYSENSFLLEEHCQSNNHCRKLDSVAYKFLLTSEIDRRVLIIHKKKLLKNILEDIPLESKDGILPFMKFICNVENKFFCLLCKMTLEYSQKGGSIKKHLICKTHKDQSYLLVCNQNKRRRLFKSSYLAVLPSTKSNVQSSTTQSFKGDEVQSKPKLKRFYNNIPQKKRVFDIVKQNRNIMMISCKTKPEGLSKNTLKADVTTTSPVNQRSPAVKLLSYKPLENEQDEEILYKKTVVTALKKKPPGDCASTTLQLVDVTHKIPKLDEKELKELIEKSLEAKLNEKYFKLKEGRLYCEPCRQFVHCNNSGPLLQQHCRSVSHNSTLSSIADDFLSKLNGTDKILIGMTRFPEGVVEMIQKMNEKYPGTRSTHHLNYLKYDGSNFVCLLCDILIQMSHTARFVKLHFLSEVHQTLSYKLLCAFERSTTDNRFSAPVKQQAEVEVFTCSSKQSNKLTNEKRSNEIATNDNIVNPKTTIQSCATLNKNLILPDSSNQKHPTNGEKPKEDIICSVLKEETKHEDQLNTSNKRASSLETIVLKRLLKKNAGTFLHSEYFCIKDGNFFCQVCIEAFEFTQFSTYLDLHCESHMHNKVLEKLAMDFVFSCARTYQAFLSEEEEEKFKFAICALQGKFPICNFKYKLMYIGFNSGSFICLLCKEPIAYEESGKSIYQHLITKSHKQNTLALLLNNYSANEKAVSPPTENLSAGKIVRRKCSSECTLEVGSQIADSKILRSQDPSMSALSTSKDQTEVVSLPGEAIQSTFQKYKHQPTEGSSQFSEETPKHIQKTSETLNKNKSINELSVNSHYETLQDHILSPFSEDESHQNQEMFNKDKPINDSISVKSYFGEEHSTEPKESSFSKLLESKSDYIKVNPEILVENKLVKKLLINPEFHEVESEYICKDISHQLSQEESNQNQEMLNTYKDLKASSVNSYVYETLTEAHNGSLSHLTYEKSGQNQDDSMLVNSHFDEESTKPYKKSVSQFSDENLNQIKADSEVLNINKPIKVSSVNSSFDENKSAQAQEPILFQLYDDIANQRLKNFHLTNIDKLVTNPLVSSEFEIEKTTDFQKDSLSRLSGEKANQIPKGEEVSDSHRVVPLNIMEIKVNQVKCNTSEKFEINKGNLDSCEDKINNSSTNDKLKMSATKDESSSNSHIEYDLKNTEHVKFNVGSNVDLITYILIGVCGKLKIVREFFELRGENLICTLCNCCLSPIKSLLSVEEIVQNHVFKSGHKEKDSNYQFIRSTPLSNLMNSKLSMIFSDNRQFIERRGPFYFHCKICNMDFPNFNDDMFSHINLALHFETFKHTNPNMIMVAPYCIPLVRAPLKTFSYNQNVKIIPPVQGVPLVRVLPGSLGNNQHLKPIPVQGIPVVKVSPESLGNQQNTLPVQGVPLVKVLPGSLGNNQHLKPIPVQGTPVVKVSPESLGNQQNTPVQCFQIPTSNGIVRSTMSDPGLVNVTKKESKLENSCDLPSHLSNNNTSTCEQCKELFEVYNNDLEFSLQVHSQKHKKLSEINENFELDCETNVDYICDICQRPIELLNKDLQLSKSKHYEMYHPSFGENIVLVQENSKLPDFKKLLESLGDHKQFIVLEDSCAVCTLCNWRKTLSSDTTLNLQALNRHIQDPYHLNQHGLFLEESLADKKTVQFKSIEAEIESLSNFLIAADSSGNIGTIKTNKLKAQSGSSGSKVQPDDPNANKMLRGLLENVTDEIVMENKEFIQLKGQELFCTLCSVPCGFSLKSKSHPNKLQIHFSGKLHKANTKPKQI